MTEENLKPTNLSHIALQKSERARATTRYDLAEKIICEALTQDPQNCLLHIELAEIYLEMEQLERALESAKTAVAQQPGNPFAHAVIALCFAALGRHQESETHYLEALRIHPESSYLLICYAHLTHKVGDHKKAEKLLLRSLRLEPEHAGAHSLLSLVRSSMEDRAGAKQSGEEGLGLEPDEELAHVALGLNHLQSGRPFKSRKHLREACRIDPTNEGVIEAFQHADRACRWIFLPMYFISLWMEKIKGGMITLWITFILLIQVLQHYKVSYEIINIIAIGYLSLVIYTWLSTPLVLLWLKVKPAK